MDEQEAKPKTGEGINIVEHKVILDRSKIEEKMQEEITKEKLEKEKLNEKLNKLTEELNTMKDQKKEQTEEYEKIKKDAEENKNKLLALANKEFERRKLNYVEAMKKSGIDEGNIKDVTDKIKTPSDLDNAESYTKLLNDLLLKRQAEEKRIKEEQEKKTKEEQEKLEKEAKEKEEKEKQTLKGGGVVPLGEGGKKQFVYTSYREGIDDLYAKARKGDKDATRLLKELWEQAGKSLKRGSIAFSVQQCVRCGAGIEEGKTCPYCGFDPATYVHPRLE